MKRIHVAWLALIIASTTGCPPYSPSPIDMVDTDSATGSGTESPQGTTAGVPDDTTAGPVNDTTAAPPEGETTTTANETLGETGMPDDTTGPATGTTGGCMPGVFGDSVFGEACFQ